MPKEKEHRLHPDTRKSIWGVSFLGAAVILALAWFSKAGPAGDAIYQGLDMLFGWGYFILPMTLLLAATVFFASERKRVVGTTLAGSALLILSVLGFIELVEPTKGGWLGLILGSLRIPFGTMAAIILDGILFIIAILVTANVPIKLRRRDNEEGSDEEPKATELLKVTGDEMQKTAKEVLPDEKKRGDEPDKIRVAVMEPKEFESPGAGKKQKTSSFANYVPPPLSLLNTDSTKPTTGDLLANANIIKRTLESFGIPALMGEINVGPAVTRYTLKPAEGIKLSRITALNPDLSLSLAAAPIRIEAPIPGKSLVGIEVPNKSAAIVRLGSLMNYPDFQKAGLSGFVMGRDVSGEPVFANIDKMPHLLVAGATGSGKSIFVHSLLISLLYKNSPETLKLILIDPKRVELSVYDGIPHLISPVITENKKAAGVFRWAISEMEKRYEMLQRSGSRDIKSYNASHREEPMPFIVIAIDELADLMSSFGREVEGSIVRLAQMARATGIHLILATQRPSVEVITGLIKANITARVALQVASQIDSRTIIDTPGAEKLLGHGDLLFISAELSKPRRIQGSFITEDEIKNVTNFIRKNNSSGEAGDSDSINFKAAGAENGNGGGIQNFDDYMTDGDSDELMDEAIAIVKEANKASASLLQRRLKVGYARAARLLDLMENAGLIGPGDGAKPRDINVEKNRRILGVRQNLIKMRQACSSPPGAFWPDFSTGAIPLCPMLFPAFPC